MLVVQLVGRARCPTAAVVLAGCVAAEPSGPADETWEPLPTVSLSACVGEPPTGEPKVSGYVFDVVDHPEIPAVASAPDGSVVLAGLPMHEQLLIRTWKDGYETRYRPLVTGDVDFFMGRQDAQRLENTLSANSDIVPDLSRGHLYISVRDPAKGKPGLGNGACPVDLDDYLENITVDASTPSGTPCYSPSSGGCAGSALQNGGIFLLYNADPGWVDLTIGPADLVCDPEIPDTGGWQFAWASGEPYPYRFRVIAGGAHYQRVYCSHAE